MKRACQILTQIGMTNSEFQVLPLKKSSISPIKLLFLVSFLILAFSLPTWSQTNFPNSWIGTYEGELHIFTIDSVAVKVKMQIDIQPTANDSVFQWKMTYANHGVEDVRDYRLRVKNKKKGIYQMDELNSILIDAYYRNGVFSSFFEVEKSFIVAEYTKIEDNLYFDIISAVNQPTSSGHQEVNGEPIPEVLSYPVNGRQKAILHLKP